MSITESVCPKCGTATGTNHYCTNCGLDLETQDKPPSREEWIGRQDQAAGAHELPVSWDAAIDGGVPVPLSRPAQNAVVATRFRANWIGLFSGENQRKAVERVLSDLNRSGLGCCALTQDRWNPFVRLWWTLVAIATLGLLVKVPNVLVVAEPAEQGNLVSNSVVATRYRGGWAGLFSGENQTKSLQRVLADMNTGGLGCCGIVQDSWNPFVRLFWVLVAVITLGFLVRIPNVLVVMEPIR